MMEEARKGGVVTLDLHETEAALVFASLPYGAPSGYDHANYGRTCDLDID